MEWTKVSNEIANRIGLNAGSSREILREMRGCLYKRDEEGVWWEMEIPQLPVTNPF